MSRFDGSRSRERIMDGYRLASFSKIEGVDYDYLRYEIMKSHEEQSLLHRLGARIKEYLMQFCAVSCRTAAVCNPGNEEHTM